ncbi:NUDIX domain-containing protein [Clostridium sp. KNHs205]|uniref:NUDIX hydrolase n=1 Tax=Clostridium sp. KNHs205 TaxID=1449050 RepID=UPI00068FC3E0|nr:NUDIX domain-containing protein [Clostridium sp. KNHs205]
MKNQNLNQELPRDKRGLTEEEFLAGYNPAKYERPSVTVDMLIFTIREQEKNNYRKLPEKTLSLLLIQRGEHPHLGKWALPGGFVGMEENLEDAALRELEEETGLKDIYLEQLYTWGDVGRDARTRVISTSYMALTDSKSLVPKASDDAANAAWFSAELKLKEEKKEKYENGYKLKQTYKLILTGEQEILSAGYEITKTIGKGTIHTERRLTESNGLAFDHGKIIAYAIDRLRNKVLYTDIAFHLMPEYFTLTELQQVYEVLLDKELLKANFRRKIADMVLETEKYRTDAGHRPSKLYQFNRY